MSPSSNQRRALVSRDLVPVPGGDVEQVHAASVRPVYVHDAPGKEAGGEAGDEADPLRVGVHLCRVTTDYLDVSTKFREAQFSEKVPARGYFLLMVTSRASFHNKESIKTLY